MQSVQRNSREVLDEGRLAGVALDVTKPEPLPTDHRLWDYPNVFITPHISGFYHLPETLDKVVNICTENLKRYMQGQRLRNVMDFQAGYCSGNKNKAIGYGMPCAVRNSDIAQGTSNRIRQKIKSFKIILTFDTTFVKILNCDDELTQVHHKECCLRLKLVRASPW